MKQTSGSAKKAPADGVLKDIRRATRRQFSAEEKIRVVLEGLRGEESIAELCRREVIATSMYYGWSKEFLGEACASINSGALSRTICSSSCSSPRISSCKANQRRAIAWRATRRELPHPTR
jgi:hypothetical protein